MKITKMNKGENTLHPCERERERGVTCHFKDRCIHGQTERKFYASLVPGLHETLCCSRQEVVLHEVYLN